MPSFIGKQTTLDLNGPVLSFVQHPETASSCTSGIATFVGLATATFPTQDPVNPATGTGYISYNWYLNDEALTDGDLNGTTVIGAATTTLTLSGISSAVLFNSSRIFLRADYIPSAYSQPDGSDVNAGTARSTGNALNDPKDSETALLTVYPDVIIVRQPGIASTDISATQNAILTVTSDRGEYFSIDSSNFSSFSNFISGREYTIRTNRDVKTKVYGVGGGGGAEVCRSALTGGYKGGNGGASQGTFTFLSGQTYKLRVGGGGGFGGGAGYSGGGAAGPGAGGGGGFTGLFLNSVSQENSIIIAGGSGGSSGDVGEGGAGGGLVGGNSSNAGRGGYGGTQSSGGAGAGGGGSGSALQGGSGSSSGAAGGGGYFGGGGGGGTCSTAGAGGGGSGYLSPLLITDGQFSATNSAGGGRGRKGQNGEDGSFKIEFLETVKKSYADTTVAQGSAAVFTVEASTTDNSQGDVSYQWQLNGVNLEDDSEFSSFPSLPKITIIDSLGGSTTVSLSELSSYSNFITGRIYTLVSDFTIDVKAYAVGAGGGGSTGGKGGAAQGTITLLANKEYKLVVGLGGSRNGKSDVSGGGSSGGNEGGNSGGGFTGIFFNAISQSGEANFPLLIAGGGGGAAENDYRPGGDGGGLNGANGAGENGATQTRGGFAYVVGGNGSALKGGDANVSIQGAGGGGGGYWGGGSARGDSNFSPGPYGGGGGSGYIHPTLVKDGSFSSTNSAGGGTPGTNGSFKLEWLSTHIVNKTSVSGSKTNRLTLTLPNVSTNLVRVAAIHPTACNSPVYSDSIEFEVVPPTNRALVRFEGYNPNSTTAILQEFDLTNEDYILDSSIINSDTICFFAKERDIFVELELYGARGEDSDYTNPTRELGGEGGYSKVRFTMKKNEEYILKGIQSKTALYLYRKAQLIACVGQGGKGGHYGAGGRGGGVNVAGETGFGRLSGNGGEIIQIGQMSGNGVFGSSSGATTIYSEDSKASGRDGGRTISCTKGVYWRDQGRTACADLGTVRFRLSNGTEVTDSSSIIRGYKDGYGINQTAGTNGGSDGGKGGNGATGGSGGSSGGGGGGSGYTDGSITIVDTTLGGHNSQTTKMIIRSFEQVVGDLYEDSSGRILILSCATAGKDPRTLTKTNGKVLPGTDTCLDDIRWQNFIELAKTQNYRLAVTLDGSTTSLIKASEFNIRSMINSNNITLKTSLTGWEDTNYSYQLLALAWDETNVGGGRGFGSDYSILSWSPLSAYGFGYYGGSSNPFFVGSTSNHFTANWWILPPGVPDFP